MSSGGGRGGPRRIIALLCDARPVEGPDGRPPPPRTPGRFRVGVLVDSEGGSCPYISATTWLTADHLRMSSLCSSASRWIIPAGIHWTSCRSTVYTVFVGFGSVNPSDWGISFFMRL